MSGLLLQERDLDLAVGAYRHGVLLRDHVWRLYFPGCGLRRCTRRLRILTAARILVGEPLPLGSFAVGVGNLLPCPGQYAYRLGERGIPLVAGRLELDAAAVRRRIRAAPSYVGHAVAVASVHVALRQFEALQGYRLREFLTELEARHRFEWRANAASPWQAVEVRPDALAWIKTGDTSLPLLLEADLATQGTAAFAQKLAGYALYCQTGAFARRFGDLPFRLAIVTTSPARLAQLAALVRESGSAGGTARAIALASFDDLFARGPLAPIWHVPGSGEEGNQHVLPYLSQAVA